ncbi:cation transporter [Actinoplanes sp. NPDC049118]|uniref:cation transporter n=1 Tax=Actinoplanes sp. NPDC049118 TaxID=3155769 RepID=UPI0033CCCE35
MGKPRQADAHPSRERSALRTSLFATAVLAALGVGWGLAAGSQAILLDGAYTLIGMALTGLSLHAARLMDAGPTPRYPFGRESLAPLVVGMQGLVLLGTCGYAALDATRVIIDGGSEEISPGSMAAYGLLTAVAALIIHRYLRRADPASDLLDAEARQWWAGALLSMVVLVGSALTLLLGDRIGPEPRRYLDPVLVLVACLLLVPQPVRMIRTMAVELLEGAADQRVQQPVRDGVERVGAQFGLDAPVLRVGKVGRKLYVEADFVVEPGRWDVADEDRVRREVAAQLADLPYDVWLNVGLTTERG